MIGLAAVICGMGLSIGMNYHLELGQSWREQLLCGWLWSGGMCASFIMGLILFR